MEWLTPLTALYAGAAAVPLLLLLYFLKLKRREQIVSSTLLWKRAVQDLQVNAPFQRIRRNILLLLQLLMLLAILFGLAWPVLSLTAGSGRRYVLLIDRSASMNAVDVAPSRLDAAKEQAKLFIESLPGKAFFSLKGTGDQIMVIAFGKRAKVMCNFTSDKRQALAAIEAIRAGDGDSLLGEAVVVARAFAQSPGVEADNRSAEEPAQLVLFSDGRIRDLDQIAVASDELIFNCVGKSVQNIAITAMQARRSYENPDEIDIFATLANYGATRVNCDLQLSLNADVRAVRSVTIPGRTTTGDSNTAQPGKAAVSFSLSHADAGVLEVRQLHSDCLSCDDAAWAILSAPTRLSVLLVTAGNIVLESALRASPLGRLEICTPAEFDAMDHAALSVEQPYDVIVLDNHVPTGLPKCRYLTFGRPPDNIDVSVPQQLENQVMVDWRSRHPVLQYVNLTNLFAARCYKMSLPRDAEVLAEFDQTPALALLRRNGSVFLLAGFDVLQTNWPFEPGFVLFCYNAASFLGMEVARNQDTNLRVGQPIVVEGLPPETLAGIEGPGVSGGEIKANPAGLIRFPGTDRVGVYSLNVPDQPLRLFAVNLLDARESDIEPAREIVLSGQSVQAQQRPFSRSNLALWPFLVGLALVLACLEWLVYNHKVRI
ncbi:MAG TPA: VWA domain-containing protein [Sedimentisphaerales bacterium]|nr:VWA domain-containing protein [Sedimentisphaerales bacterium]